MREPKMIARSVLLAVGLVIASVPAVTADPIQITSGSLIHGGSLTSPRSLTLAGGGFTFEGTPVSGLVTPIEQCSFPECTGGVVVNLRARWVGLDLPGTATFEERTFTNVGGLASDSSLSAEWTGTLTIPPAFTGGDLTAPFLFSGLFRFDLFEEGARDVGLFGGGLATLTLAPHAGHPGAFRVESLVYQFGSPEPIPEPASMLLMGTGLAGLAAVRRRRRRT